MMNRRLLTDVVDELARVLTGGRVERVVRDLRSDLYVSVRAGTHRWLLLLSPDRSFPRLHLVTRKPSAAPMRGGLELYLKTHLTGARVASVGLLNGDRIVQIGFSRQEKRYCLVFELFGPFPNIMLLGEDDVILSVHRAVPAGETISRPVLPGMTYSPPERRGPVRNEGEASEGAGAGGNGPGGPVPANRHAEELFRQLLDAQSLSDRRRLLSRSLRRALSRAERKVVAIEADLERAGRADDLQRAGTAILANLDRIRKGMASAELVLHDDTRLNVDLDPSLSPRQNADRFFTRYKKAKAGRGIIESRLSDARADLSFIEQRMHALSNASSHEDLENIEDSMDRSAIGKSGEKIEKIRNKSIEYPNIRRYSFNGWDVMVGKNASANEEITFRIAGDDDIWLHAEGIPGSHVVIRNPGGAEVPQEVLLRAASLAAYHSKGRNAGKVSVTFTRARNVRKPRGAPRGTVALVSRRSIMVAPEDGRNPLKS